MTATKPNAIGAPGYSETMPCRPESARSARRLVRRVIETWRFPNHLIEDAELVISELVGNSVRHSRCHLIRVVISRTSEHRVRVAVSDRSRKPPSPRAAAGEDENGRGLRLVAGHVESWGTEHRRWGKIVWAELVAGGGTR